MARRPDHIEDALIKIHSKGWFTWTDYTNKIYANLRLTEKIGVDGELVDNPHSLPTEEEINTKLLEIQAIWDDFFAEYKEARRRLYLPFRDQFDQLYHDIDDGKLGEDAKTGTWYLALKTIKDANPKP
jgi:hypothetical protein